VLNARIDVFLPSALAGAPEGTQAELVAEGLERARRSLDAGADCVYPIALWEPGTLAAFIDGVPGPVNALPLPRAPSLPELAALGAARVSWGTRLHREAMDRFARALETFAG
jgi:2-methylisocitrate lyase-like PEP mutase family enzyme